jgi:hypothetical protein
VRDVNAISCYRQENDTLSVTRTNDRVLELAKGVLDSQVCNGSWFEPCRMRNSSRGV